MNPRRQRLVNAFSLIEVLLSTAILALILSIVTSLIGSTQSSWRKSESRADQFQRARSAFDLVSGNLRQATLNPYWDYFWESTGSNVPPARTGSGQRPPPDAYVRYSELHYINGQATDLVTTTPSANLVGHAVFFQAPLGFTLADLDGDAAQSPDYLPLNGLLNGIGYWVEFGSDTSFRPPFLTTDGIEERWRFRLMEMRVPAEDNHVYVKQPTNAAGDRWFDHSATGNIPGTSTPFFKTASASELGDFTRPVADNVVALIVSPRASEQSLPTGTDSTYFAPSYEYNSIDSDNATPTINGVQVVSGEARQGTQHLLPPIIDITLLVLDEPTALRLASIHGAVTPPELVNALNGRFTTAADFDSDLEAVQTSLADDEISLRVLRTSVVIRAAKWDGRPL